MKNKDKITKNLTKEKYFYDEEIISLGGKVYYSNVRIDKKVFKFEKLLKTQ